MIEGIGSSVVTWTIVVIVLLIWFALSLYAFWRAGRMNDRAQSLRDLADFLDTMIKTDHRYPIWIWSDGRLQADSGALSLVGLPDTVTNLNELSASNTFNPRHAVVTIERCTVALWHFVAGRSPGPAGQFAPPRRAVDGVAAEGFGECFK